MSQELHIKMYNMCRHKGVWVSKRVYIYFCMFVYSRNATQVFLPQVACHAHET